MGDYILTGRYAPMGSEEQEQAALFEWAMYKKKAYPDLDLMFHVPNGGKRDYGTARRLKLQGVKPGVPDIALPAPKGRYHGLYIELKAGKNKPTPAQKKYILGLMERGYCCLVCYGAGDAGAAIELYLNEDTKRLRLYEDFTLELLAHVKNE